MWKRVKDYDELHLAVKNVKKGRHRRKLNNHIVLGHDDLLFVVKHVEKGQTPQKL